MLRRSLPIALVLLLVAAAVVKVPGHVEAAYVSGGRLIEGFENGTLPDKPTSPYFTFTAVGSGNDGYDITTFDTGAQSYKVDGTVSSATYKVEFDLGGTNLCTDSNEIGSTRHIDFAVRNNEGNGNWGVRLRNAASNDFAAIEGVNAGVSAGFVYTYFDNTAGNVAPSPTFNDAVDTAWKHYGIRCSNTAATFVDFTTGTSHTKTMGSGTFTPTVLELYSTGAGVIIGPGNNVPPAVNFDNIGLGTPPPIVANTPAGPVITVVGLTGFDVDRSGTTAILRTHDAAGNTQDNVRTYDAQTLSSPGNVLNSECNRLSGVAALANYVTFFECDGGQAGDVDFVKIRSASLGDPVLPTFCSEGIDFCDTDIDANELAGCQGFQDGSPDDCDSNDFQLDLVEIDEIPFDYSAFCNANGDFSSDTASRLNGEPCGTRDAVYFAWGATFEDGYVGVVTYAMNRGADDKSQFTKIQVGPNTSTIDQICVVQDSDGLSYLYAAEGSSQMKGYALNFDIEAGGQVDASTLNVEMVPLFPGTAQTSAATAVACGEEKFVTAQPNGNLCIFARDSGSPLVCRTVSAVPEGGVAMSGDGNYIAWVEGSTLRVGCAKVGGCPATSVRDAAAIGAVVATGTVPTGTFRAIKMDANANSVWIATDVRVQHYNAVFQATTGNATACLPGDVGCGPTPTGGPTGTGGPGQPNSSDNGLLGVSARDSILGGLAVTLGVGILGYGMTRRKEG